MKLTTFIIFNLLCLCSGFAQTVDLSNWKIDSFPEKERLMSANQSKDNWIFQKKGNKYFIIQNDYKKDQCDDFPFPNDFNSENLKVKFGNRNVKKVSDGYINRIKQWGIPKRTLFC